MTPAPSSADDPDVAPALAAALASYLDHLAVERGLARNTLLSYRRDLAGYARYLSGRGVGAVGEVAEDHVMGYLRSLREPPDGSAPLAASSAARALVAARGWHRYLVAEGIVETDPARDVRPPQAAKRLPKALTVEQVMALLEAARIDDGPRGLRDAALLEFLYATGARISEAVGLDVDDVDPDAGVVRLLGKGSKERIVPVGSYARDAIEAYRVRGRPALVGGGAGGGSGAGGGGGGSARRGSAGRGARSGRPAPALFVNVRGGRLSRQSAWQVLHDAAERAGITEAVSPHTLRHSFATHLIMGGADVRTVQELLGHASVTTTQIYTLVTVDALREVYALAHPRAR